MYKSVLTEQWKYNNSMKENGRIHSIIPHQYEEEPVLKTHSHHKWKNKTKQNKTLNSLCLKESLLKCSMNYSCCKNLSTCDTESPRESLSKMWGGCWVCDITSLFQLLLMLIRTLSLPVIWHHYSNRLNAMSGSYHLMLPGEGGNTLICQMNCPLPW